MVTAKRSNARRVRGAIRHLPVLAVGLIMLTVPCAAAEFAGGTGEPNDPYLIATAEQLLAADFGQAGVCFRLCQDIDLNRQTIRPRYFRAHFDGAGFEIRSIVITEAASFFGEIEPEGTVTNLTLADLDLGLAPWLWPWTSDLSLWVGAMAAENYGTISNCEATATVEAGEGSTDIGGLAGLDVYSDDPRKR